MVIYFQLYNSNYLISNRASNRVLINERLSQWVPKMLNEEARLTENVIHGFDCKESADNEIALFRKLAKLNKSR